MIIREATLADVPDLVAMGLAFRASTGYAQIIAENAAQMEETAKRLIAQDDAAIFVSENREGTTTGMIGLQLFMHHISGALTCGEVMWYVRPDHRGSGVRLLVQAENWARAKGAVTIQMIQPVGTNVDEIYTAMNYTAIEVAWHKRLTQDTVAA